MRKAKRNSEAKAKYRSWIDYQQMLPHHAAVKPEVVRFFKGTCPACIANRYVMSAYGGPPTIGDLREVYGRGHKRK
jgi:hypothetical protein